MSRVGWIFALSITIVGCDRAATTEAPSPPPAEPPPPSAPAAVSFGSAAAPAASRIRVLVAGDLLPHRPSLVSPASIRTALAPLAGLFEKADGVVANYEASTGDPDVPRFRLAYTAPPEWLAELPGAGIGNVTVANNHACDLGTEGLDATLEAASAAGVVAIGGDARDPWTARVIAERDGKRVCAVAWTTVMNATGACRKSTKLAFASLDRRGKMQVDRALARARAAGCDATIAIFHGGEEYVRQTTLVMDHARHAAEAGADAVVVHHPHITSPVELHATKDGRKVPVFASVGNLVSNQGESWKPPMFPVLRENRRLVCVNGWTRLGMIADLAFSFEGDETRLEWGYHLTWTENEHVENKEVAVPKIEARLLDPDGDATIIARLSDDEKGPVDVFDDGCWIERPVYVPGDAEAAERCRTSIRHGAPAENLAGPGPVARKRVRRAR